MQQQESTGNPSSLSSVQSDSAKDSTLNLESAKLSDVDIPLLENLTTGPQKEQHGDESLSSTPNTSQLTNVETTELNDGKERKFEFSFIWNGKLHFATCWDTNLLSACERVLCEPILPDRLIKSKTGNYFLVDNNDNHWAVKISPITNSFVLEDFHLAPEEKKTTRRSVKSELNTGDILKGLI